MDSSRMGELLQQSPSPPVPSRGGASADMEFAGHWLRAGGSSRGDSSRTRQLLRLEGPAELPTASPCKAQAFDRRNRSGVFEAGRGAPAPSAGACSPPRGGSPGPAAPREAVRQRYLVESDFPSDRRQQSSRTQVCVLSPRSPRQLSPASRECLEGELRGAEARARGRGPQGAGEGAGETQARAWLGNLGDELQRLQQSNTFITERVREQRWDEPLPSDGKVRELGGQLKVLRRHHQALERRLAELQRARGEVVRGMKEECSKSDRRGMAQGALPSSAPTPPVPLSVSPPHPAGIGQLLGDPSGAGASAKDGGGPGCSDLDGNDDEVPAPRGVSPQRRDSPEAGAPGGGRARSAELAAPRGSSPPQQPSVVSLGSVPSSAVSSTIGSNITTALQSPGVVDASAPVLAPAPAHAPVRRVPLTGSSSVPSSGALPPGAVGVLTPGSPRASLGSATMPAPIALGATAQLTQGALAAVQHSYSRRASLEEPWQGGVLSPRRMSSPAVPAGCATSSNPIALGTLGAAPLPGGRPSPGAGGRQFGSLSSSVASAATQPPQATAVQYASPAAPMLHGL